MAEINKITGVVAGQYGEAIQLEIVDDEGQAVDISGYTGTNTITLRAPQALKSLSYTATFVTDGTDGQVQFTPTAATEIDRAGEWEGQIKLTAASLQAFTRVFRIIVEKKIG